MTYGYTDDKGMDAQRHGNKSMKIKMMEIAGRLVPDRSGITEDSIYRYGDQADINTGV